jgi:polyisoprenoid-binding protein YceI
MPRFAFTRGAAIAALALLPLAAGAADAPAWTVDAAKSTLGFSGSQTGTPFSGTFQKFSADIALDPQHPETAKIRASVDLASASTGDAQKDAALPGSDWFDAASFPQATFETTAVKQTGPGAYEATGTLTLRGVSRPVTLPFTLTVDGDTAHAKGHADLVRTEFGVGQGAWSSDQYVALQVGVDIDITATRAK